MSQLEIDFNKPVWPTAEMVARAHEEFSEENLCIVWWSKPFAKDRDAWNALPEYERRRWQVEYSFERERVEMGLPMRDAAYLAALAEDNYREKKRLAESWAEDIRQAFKEGKPCPIRPEPAYQSVLNWAFQLACVPPACLEAADESALGKAVA